MELSAAADLFEILSWADMVAAAAATATAPS
jgi:hypothetical protein